MKKNRKEIIFFRICVTALIAVLFVCAAPVFGGGVKNFAVAADAGGAAEYLITGAASPTDEDRELFAADINGVYGDGLSAETAYIIKTAAQLDNMRLRLYIPSEDFFGTEEPYYFVLNSDIDLAPALSEGGELYGDGKGWNPVGNENEYEFHGVIDGRGHTVRNLWADRQDELFAGLFGTLRGAEVKNLNIMLDGRGITGGGCAGGVAGYATEIFSFFAQGRKTVISGCSVSGFLKTIKPDMGTGWQRGCGGITGMVNGADLAGCYFTGTIESASYAGGIAGQAVGASAENCYAVFTAKEVVIAEEDSSGTGGIFGADYSFGTQSNINYCYADLTAPGGGDAFVEGVIHCYITRSYYVIRSGITTGGEYDADSVRGIEPSGIKTKASYPAFDFINVWGIYEGAGRPYLRRFSNDLLIVPEGKIYDATDEFISELSFTGLIAGREIEAQIKSAAGLVNAGSYEAEVAVKTAYAYQISFAPYVIRPALLTVRAGNVTRGYGNDKPAFTYALTGFKGSDGEDILRGLDTVLLSAAAAPETKLKRGSYAVEIYGELEADNYIFAYEPGMLTVKGLYPYEIALTVSGAAVLLALAALAVVYFGVKKKTVYDLARAVKGVFVKEKTVVKTETVVERVEVIKEVPVNSGQPLPMGIFTHKEKKVAELLLLGKSRKEIARELKIGEETVKTHTGNILSKTEVHTQKAFIAKYLYDKEYFRE